MDERVLINCWITVGGKPTWQLEAVGLKSEYREIALLILRQIESGILKEIEQSKNG